jgi:predicted O-linked N-acetylglucosamine transferase (SPINDLY family)
MSDQILQNAWRLHQAGNLNEAARLYQDVLRANPRNFNALQLLGFVHFQRGEFADAERIMEKAIRINPSSVDALYNRGCALQALDRPKEALQCFGKALTVKPDFVPAHVNRGNVLSQLQRYDEALASYDKALALQPDSAEALLNRGNALLELKRPADALSSYDKALAREPRDPTAWNNRGSALEELGRHEEAIASFSKAAALAPDYPDAFENRGNALMSLRRHPEALGDLDRALALEPNNARALYSRATILKMMKRPEEALAAYDRALAIEPAFVEALIARGNALAELKRYPEGLESLDAALAHNPKSVDALSNRANVLIRSKRHEEALADCDNALALEPSHAGAWHNRGSALSGLKRYREALASFERALSLDQTTAATWNNRGNTLIALKRYAESLSDFDAALALDPHYVDAFSNRANAQSGLKNFAQAIAAAEAALVLDPEHAPSLSVLVHCGLHACDWTALERDKPKVIAGLKLGRRTIQPFDCKAIASSEEDNLHAARLWVADECPASPKPLWRGERYRHDRIRVAYLSTDLRAHAVGFLIVGAIECHDRSRFETTGISLGADDKSETRARFEAGFDRFIDVRERNDNEVASLLRDMEIDIAVDLNGFTGDPRTRILARRPAPIQVNYLGYPGTMGADYIDYIIADPILIPPEDERHYSEKIAYLPDTYQANDSRRATVENIPSRADAGLPQTGFVFASFNNTYKISPEMFAVWMRLLSGIEGSVLWLLEDNPYAAENLKREATARKVNPDRLIFAPRTTPDKHLARQPLADLFLDTLPYNAHTTASDALWVGLPVVTTPGTTFPGRVAASLISAIGLPELIAPSLGDYEQLAMKLARDPTALAALKAKLSSHRTSFPLFDTKRFTRHLEAALTQMWERQQAGLPPQTFSVVPQ